MCEHNERWNGSVADSKVRERMTRNGEEVIDAVALQLPLLVAGRSFPDRRSGDVCVDATSTKEGLKQHCLSPHAPVFEPVCIRDDHNLRPRRYRSATSLSSAG